MELLERLRDVLDAHPDSDLPVEVERRESLLRMQATPAVVVDPVQRVVDERRQHVQHVVVVDRVFAVHAVDVAQRFTSTLGVVPVLDEFGHQQGGVVVALLRPMLELAGPGEQLGDGRYTVRAEQRELERPLVVPRELVSRGDPQDVLMMGDRVEVLDHLQPAVSSGLRMRVAIRSGERPGLLDPRFGRRDDGRLTRSLRARSCGGHLSTSRA